MKYPSWFLEILRCPEEGSPLQFVDNAFVRPDGKKYPVVDGIPCLVFPGTSKGKDEKWQKFYDAFARLYDWNERLGARLLTGINRLPMKALTLCFTLEESTSLIISGEL